MDVANRAPMGACCPAGRRKNRTLLGSTRTGAPRGTQPGRQLPRHRGLTAHECALSEIADVYRMRWEVEEFFKAMKGPYIGQGQFRSKSPTGVRQEVSALVLFLAITRLCVEAVDDNTVPQRGKPSQKAAVMAVACHLTRILLPTEHGQVLRELQLLGQRISQARYRPRAGRSFRRVSLKPTPRWGASGRRGA